MSATPTHRRSGRPPGPSLRALVTVNAALLAVLALVTLAPAVGAQGRARGEYLMVAGGVNSTESSAVYIVDAVNQEMLIVAYEHATRRLRGIAYRNLAADAADVGRARTRPGG